MKKEAVDYDYSTHEMEWKVEVDTKGQELEGNLRTLDLLVYGKSFDIDTIDNIETGFGDIGDLTYVSKETLEKLIPQYGYGQKIKPDSFATEDELEYVVYSLTSDGKKVADLMVVTGKGKKGIPHTGANSYSYSTIICDPDIYATNRSTRILNTVSLFSGETELNSALAAKTIQSNMLAKDSLTRENAALILGDKPLDAQEVLAAINNGGSGTAVDKSFDYQDKSVLYRIYVNGNGLTNATEDLTTVAGEKLGNYKIQDVLPKGWEFRKIQGMDFVLYEAASEREGNTPKITAEALVDSYEDILTMAIAEGTDTQGQAMSFDFKRLTKPYVILLKAGPTKDALEEYFEKNQDYTEKNTVSLVENPNITIPVSGSKDVKISSKVLGKGYQQDGSGEMTWNVEYKPCGTEQEDTFLTDTLPQGIELRVDSKGELVIPGNISITELIHEKDGSYTDGAALTLPDEGILSYDNATRVLTFVPPIKEKAYRLTYVTDITGEPGTISNKAQLYKKGASAVDTASAYSISEDDYGASFLRSGWIQVQKIDGDSKTPLTGAKFTIFSMEGTIIREAKSNADGILSLKTLPEGEYVLKETEAPAGYALSEKTYRVKVEKQADGTFKTDVAGEKLTDGVLTVANFKVGTVGALEVTKIVAGNAGDKNKTFDFTLELRNAAGVELAGDFDYTIKNQEGTIVEEGVLGSGAQFSLSHEQTLRLWNIPKESQYTITEADYAGEGYHTTIDGNESREAAGIIEVDAAASVTIINTKNKPASDNGGNGGQEEDRDSAPATAADSANKAVTIPSESKGVLPKTGRETRAVYYVLGAASIAAGILVLARKDKKRNAKK